MLIAYNLMGKWGTDGRYIGIRRGERCANICLKTMCLIILLIFIQEITQCDKLKFNLTAQYHG